MKNIAFVLDPDGYWIEVSHASRERARPSLSQKSGCPEREHQEDDKLVIASTPSSASAAHLWTQAAVSSPPSSMETTSISHIQHFQWSARPPWTQAPIHSLQLSVSRPTQIPWCGASTNPAMVASKIHYTHKIVRLSPETAVPGPSGQLAGLPLIPLCVSYSCVCR